MKELIPITPKLIYLIGNYQKDIGLHAGYCVSLGKFEPTEGFLEWVTLQLEKGLEGYIEAIAELSKQDGFEKLANKYVELVEGKSE